LKLENDILGALLWGPATQPTLSLGRADIWDRRWFGDRQPLITMARIRELAMADRLSDIMRHANDSVYNVYHLYDFPCPKPGAQLILGTPFASSVCVRRLPGRTVEIVAEGEEKRLLSTVWVSLCRSLVLLSCRAEGLCPKDLWVRVYRHRDTILPGCPMDPTVGGKPSAPDFEPLPAPRSFYEGRNFGIIQDFAPELTFPGGFSVAVLATVLDANWEIECRDNERGLGTPLWAEQEGRLDHGTVKRYTPINESPGAAATASLRQIPASFTVLAAIATTQDGPDPAAEASGMLDEARELGGDGLLEEHGQTLRQAERKPRASVRVTGRAESTRIYGVSSTEETKHDGGVEIKAAETVLPPLRRPGGLYGDVPLCSVGSTKFWFQDAGLWHNDFHLNEIRAEPMLTLGLFPELLPYCEMVHGLLPMAEENAREVYGLPGAMYPLVHFPIRCRGVTHTNPTWEQDMGLNGLVTKPLWLYYRYTGDEEFLRELAYPVLRSCARFCRSYVRPEDDGYLHIFPTVSPEHWGLTARFARNRDCLSALTLTRYLFRAAAQAARSLGVDGEEAADWAASAERLAPFPTFQTPDGPVWVDVAGAPPIEYNIPVPLSAVFWGDEVGLDSPPDLLETARRTLAQIRVWRPHSFYLDWCIRPRLGVWGPDSKLVPECFLLSYQSIRIFPSVPPEGEIVMEDFAAEGGFRVSAARTAEGTVENVRITSVLGHPCRLANPWPGRQVVCNDEKGDRVVSVGEVASHISFKTDPGERYRLTPT
jgi:hypothetical protein